MGTYNRLVKFGLKILNRLGKMSENLGEFFGLTLYVLVIRFISENIIFLHVCSINKCIVIHAFWHYFQCGRVINSAITDLLWTMYSLYMYLINISEQSLIASGGSAWCMSCRVADASDSNVMPNTHCRRRRTEQIRRQSS